MKKVNILLSTYNGEKYLEEQIDSLLAQTYGNYIITVRDDGSIDNTNKILQNYISNDRTNRFRYINCNIKENIGYPDCFWTLLKECENADYYAFCDQDDVWMPEKISSMVQKLDEENQNQAILCFHDYYICDAELNILGTHDCSELETIRGYQLIFYTYVQGFAMTINDKMKQLLLSQNPVGKGWPHDGWIIWTAFYRGKMLYNNTVLSYYRRHANTETISGKNIVTQTNSWIKEEIIGDKFTKLCKRAYQFSNMNISNNEDDNIKIWRLLSAPSSVSEYMRRLLFSNKLRPSLGGELALRILFLLNIK